MLDLYKNIKKYRLQIGLTQTELAAKLGYADKSMIAKIEAGKVDLSQSKITEFAKTLNTTPSDLMGWDTGQPSHYTDPDVEALAQELYDRPDLRVLFSTTKKVSKEDLEFVKSFVERLAKERDGEPDEVK